MARLCIVFVITAVAAAGGCGTSTATQEPQRDTPAQSTAVKEPKVAISVPENPADRGIRRDLALAIAHDATLNARNITFIVANGDVSVTGVVRTEEERKKINDMAMNIDGVKSVANAVRVEE